MNEMHRAIKLKHWESIFRAQAESGMTIASFCQENSICKTTYYNWLRRARDAYIRKNTGAEIVELTETEPQTRVTPQDKDAGKVFIRFREIEIEVHEDTSRELMLTVLEVLNNV